MVRQMAMIAGVCAAQAASGQTIALTDWVLTELDGAPAPYSATLTIVGTRISGKAPCNRFTGEILGDLPNVTLGPIVATRMACDALADEAAYFSALGAVTQMVNKDGTLTLSGTGQILAYGLQAK